jgi:lipoate-protein ligase A
LVAERIGARTYIGAVTFVVEHAQGPVAQLHASQHLLDTARVVNCVVDDAVMVLGSGQARELDVQNGGQIDGPHGISLTRRRSGGGAVWVAPGAQTWLDITLPASHECFESDVRRSFGWIGEAWRLALAGLGVAATVWPASYDDGGDLADVCFASRGPGELVDAETGAKLVGISQRRTREGALFQCQVQHVLVLAPYQQLFGLDAAQIDRLGGLIGRVEASTERVIDALVRHLPA